MNILGLSAYYHDSAAALVVDGKIVAAAQEERFTRIKHDSSFPRMAIDYCLEEGGIRIEDLDYVVFYEKPLLKFERLLETYLSFAPAGLRSFLKAMPQWLKIKLHLPRQIREGLQGRYNKAIAFVDHHQSHAASAFFPSPFEDAAILTIDGVGEWDCATIGIGDGRHIKTLQRMRFPHSLGLLYSAFTYFCGFKVNSGEYKLMGLAPYGNPRYVEIIKEKLIDLKEDGSFALNLKYFSFCQGLRMTNSAFAALFGGPPRQPESRITQRDRDLAASIQVVTEEIVLRMAQTAKRLTGKDRLCMAGGVALNCVANGKLLRTGIFKEVWVQPASGDDGGALGAALFLQHQLLDSERHLEPSDNMQGAALGPRFTSEETQDALNQWGVKYHAIDNETDLLERTVVILQANQVVGWFQDRMEFGPRALGNRSIIGNPSDPEMQVKMNTQIKFRESFRPFAPSVLLEDVRQYFDVDRPSPYMLFVAPVQGSLCLPIDPESESHLKDSNLNQIISVARSSIPSVTHVDYSARVQTVDGTSTSRYSKLLRTWKRKTGESVLINTSFNVRGEPIVHTPSDAIRCFLATDMDCLVIGVFILYKHEQDAGRGKQLREKLLARSELD
jgi:carbamoyltransferase